MKQKNPGTGSSYLSLKVVNLKGTRSGGPTSDWLGSFDFPAKIVNFEYL